MANEVTISVKVKNDTTAGSSSVKATLKDIGDSAERSGDRIVDSMGRARESLGRFVSGGGTGRVKTDLSEIDSIGGKLSEMFGRLGQSASDGLAMLGPAAKAVQGNLGMLSLYGAAAAASLVAAFLAVVPALSAVGGAAGAALTGLVGLGAVFGVLKIGFGGVGDALDAYSKQSSKAGGSSTKAATDTKAAADRIYTAERQLTNAKEAETAAAKAVNLARADEIDRLRELDLQLRGAKISQAEAAQALVEAKEKARRANVAGSDWEKAEAKNAVARAQLTYDEQSEKLGDLAEDKKKAVKDGVEGSDQVQAALDREKKAHESVLDAQRAVATAHEKTATAATQAAGGIDLFAQAMEKLSPNAQSLVYALIDIGKRFDVIKQHVEEHLFAGWAAEVTDLADRAFPTLDRILVKTSDHLNHMGSEMMKSFGDKTFLKNIERASDGFGTFLDHLTRSGSAGTDAFGRISAAAVPFLDKVGELIERIVVNFDDWIKKVEENGSLESFFQTAADELQKIYDTCSKVLTIIGQVIAIIWPDAKSASDSAFDSVNKALDRISAWLADPKNRKQVDGFINSLKAIGTTIRDLYPIFKWIGIVVIATFEGFAFSIRTTIDWFKWLGKAGGQAWDWIYDKAKSVIDWFGAVGGWLSNTLSNAWSGLKEGFRDAINWVISKWNGLRFTMPTLLGGETVGVPQIAYRAVGGVSGGLTAINERGAELVKLPNGSMVYPAGQSAGMVAGMRGQGGQTLNLYMERSGDDLLDAVWNAIAKRISLRGGVVQTALGRASSLGVGR